MQAQNLNYTAVHNQPMVFSPQNPPFVPQINNCPQFLQTYLPYIAAALATTVGQNVQQNPHAGRIFTFNQLSNNNYANNEFASAVATAVDFIALHIHKGVYQNVEHAIQDSIPRVLSIITSMNIVNSPDMHYMLDAQITNEARRVVQQEAAQLQHEVVQFKMGTGGPQTMAMGQGYMQAPGMMAGGVMMGGAMGRPQMMQSPQQRSYMPRQNAAITSSGFGSASPNVTGQSNVQLPGGNRFMNTRTQTPVAQAPQQALQEPVILKWSPSRKQAYQPAYKPSIEVVEMVEDFDPIDSSQIVIMQINTKEEESAVNRDQHSIMFKPNAPVPAGYISRKQAFEDKLEEHTKELSNTKVHPLNKKVAKVNLPDDSATWRYASDINNAIENIRYLQMVFENGNISCKSHTEFVMLGDITLCQGDKRELVVEFHSTRTLLDLIAVMNKELARDSEFSKGVDKYVTNEFNQFIKHHIGLSGLHVDNFREDYKDLVALILKKRGQTYVDKITKMESSFINKIFLNIDDEAYGTLLASSLDDLVINGEEIERSNWATATVQAVTVTVCAISDEVIDLATPTEGEVAFVDSERFPAMEAFGQAVLKLEETAMTDNMVPIAHHYLVSSDNTVYEVIRGMYDTVLIFKKSM